MDRELFSSSGWLTVVQAPSLGCAPLGRPAREGPTLVAPLRRDSCPRQWNPARRRAWSVPRVARTSCQLSDTCHDLSGGSTLTLVNGGSRADLPYNVLTGFVKRVKNTSEGLDTFLDELIERHRSFEGNYDKPDHKNRFLEILLEVQKEGIMGMDFTQDNIKAILLNMFLGGTDTASSTMEWAMAELMKNPTKMKKAQEEVRRMVGKKSKVDQQDIAQMEYLKCVVKETLRLHPPAPFLIPRELAQSAKLGGYDIPPKTRVFVNTWAIQRDPKYWDNPEEFLPERFANNPIDFRGQDFQFIPFGAGRRGCPGISFGVMEIEDVLASLLYWFDWKLPIGEELEDLEMSEVFGPTVHKKIELQLVPVMHSP